VESNINGQIYSLISLIKRKHISKGLDIHFLDFGRVAQFFTMDVITKIAYGKEFGYLEDGNDVYRYIETIEQIVPFLAFCTSFPIIWSFFSLLWARKILSPSPWDEAGIGKLIRYFLSLYIYCIITWNGWWQTSIAQTIVDERYGPEKKDRMDMLGAFVRHGLTQE
jgi:hypothetical protein